MESIFVECVQSSLRNFMYRNAIFMCERLCAEFPSEVNSQLLATCYLRNDQAYAAYHILKGAQMAQSRYLFALSCFRMDLLSEAERALCPTYEPGLEVPNGAAGHYLLGLIYRFTDRSKNAVTHFKQALSLDPLYWAAYEELSLLGCAEEAAVVFGETAVLSILKQHQQLQHYVPTCQNTMTSYEDHDGITFRSLEDVSPRQQKTVQNSNVREVPHGTIASGGGIWNQPANGGHSNLSFYNTPSPIAAQLSGLAPPPICRNMQPSAATSSTDISPRPTTNAPIQAPRRKVVDEGKFRKISGRLFSDSSTRRSMRLSGDSGASANTNAATGNGNSHTTKYLGSSRLGHVTSRSVRKAPAWGGDSFEEGLRCEAVDDSRMNITASTSAASPSADARSEPDGGAMTLGHSTLSDSTVLSGASDILGLLRLLGEGYRLSCLHKSQEALEIYQQLLQRHYNTGWVLSQVGIAYFELMDYLEADRAFSMARCASPYRLEGMDLYSTVLYHMKEDMRLSYLAQELVSTDRLAPQAWCAMGNCYSLQKDHDTALKNFMRATQLSTRFAYAHTLCAHEYAALEDFDNGIKNYQNALRIDSRHYNAWYGLGIIYLRQEKFEFSEHHFRMAFQINPHSSVILSYLGTALHALKRNDEALMMMEKAVLADKKNPLPMYQKAVILASMEKLDEALEVLEELKENFPREGSVYALMGKIYKRRNMYDKAMLNFGLALDLKPSTADVATIKAAIEKLHVPDDLDDSS